MLKQEKAILASVALIPVVVMLAASLSSGISDQNTAEKSVVSVPERIIVSQADEDEDDDISSIMLEVSESSKEVSTTPSEPTVTSSTSPSSSKVMRKSSPVQLEYSEREYIERVVAAEARGESYLGQMAVAQTIRDRSNLWKMTPLQIVQAKGQYAGPFGGTISETTKKAVAAVFDNGESAVDGQIHYFYEYTIIKSNWHESQIFMAQIGCHRFFKRR